MLFALFTARDMLRRNTASMLLTVSFCSFIFIHFVELFSSSQSPPSCCVSVLGEFPPAEEPGQKHEDSGKYFARERHAEENITKLISVVNLRN